MRISRLLPILLTVVLAACGAPPSKEMDQAQGAIDAARAAGAAEYATTELAAATDALQSANGAVAQRDYRLALSFALESREQAQNAARTAADERARVRGEVERTLAEVAGQLAPLRARLDDVAPALARLPAHAEARAALEAVEAEVASARTLLENADYLAARTSLGGLRSQAADVEAQVETATTPPTPRRRP
ncbi:MAG: DUF4398 domain-containing protein [Acidobacteria bacterium]|nr:DUF4398 domain-containing protein [Acidobacteriota bacterium]